MILAIIGIVGLGIVAWIVWEARNAPTLDSWHDEACQARSDASRPA